MSKIPQEAIDAGARAIWERIEDEISFEKACKEKHPQIEWTIKDAEVCIEAADAARAQGAEVFVKPLEWENGYGSTYYAQSIVGQWARWEGYYRPPNSSSVECPDPVAAAQADYEQRIRSALATPPAPQPTDETCPCCGGSGHYGDAAMRAINGDIPPTEREKVLEEALRKAEQVMATNIMPKPDVGPDHPYSILKGIRAALAGKAPSQTDRAEGGE